MLKNKIKTKFINVHVIQPYDKDSKIDDEITEFFNDNKITEDNLLDIKIEKIYPKHAANWYELNATIVYRVI